MKRNFITTSEWSKNELQSILDFASELKANRIQPLLKNKSIALIFFNPSLRTKTSFQIGMNQLGGNAVIISPSQDAWPIEFDVGKIMNEEAEEHIAEVAKVLSKYCDLIAVRAFPKFQNIKEDIEDKIIRGFEKFASVPIINMETITHPCQELAHILSLQEQLGDLKNKNYLLTWTYHPKALNTAVANSSLIIASKFGMNVTLLCPTEDYLLHDKYIDEAKLNCQENNTNFTISHDIKKSYANKDIVYAKSWGSIPFYGEPNKEKKIRDQYKNFIVDERKMNFTNNALFSHCLPLRRNIKATDAVMDSDNCIAIQEAENRMHVQKSLLVNLLKE
jgi:N-acetylornithine carbamoyltransferase